MGLDDDPGRHRMFHDGKGPASLRATHVEMHPKPAKVNQSAAAWLQVHRPLIHRQRYCGQILPPRVAAKWLRRDGEHTAHREGHERRPAA